MNEQVLKSGVEERELLQAKLDDTDSKLVAAELGKSQAVSEASSYQETLQLQFTDQVTQYKVGTEGWDVIC